MLFYGLDKNGTSNWKIIKLSANTFQHSDKLESKIQWCSFIRSWVIRVGFLDILYYFYALYQKIVKREQIIENSQNIRNSQNFNVLALFALEISTLFFIFILYFYAVSQKLTKTEQTIVKLPNIQQTFEHSGKPQSKSQFCSFIRFWVIRLCFLEIYYIFMLLFRN